MTNNNNQEGILISVKDLWGLFLHKWYWFVLSTIMALSVAIVYIVITPPTFTRTASVLIKNNNSQRRTTSSSIMEPLSEFGLLKPNTDIKSEVYILKSPSIMETVVSRLKLNYNYSIKYKGVRNVDLYNSSPIMVELDSTLSNISLSFDVKLLPSEKITITNLDVNGAIAVADIRSNLSDTIKTLYGSFVVKPTVAYKDTSIGKTILFSKNEVSSVAKIYSGILGVKYDEEDAPILWLTYTDVNPQRAEDILNTLISVYNENWIKDRNQITLNTSEFIGDRLNIIEAELGGVDQDISSYKSANLIPSVEAVSSMYLSQSNSNTSKQNTLHNQLSMAQYIRSYMNEATSKNQLIPANTGIESANIENQIDKYNTLLLQKNSLLSNSSEQNPVVSDMIKNLAAMKDVILRSIDDYISTLNIQIDNMRREERVTNQKLASNPGQAKYLLSVERQQKVKEALYLFLLQKREENELTQTFSAYNTTVINVPDGSMAPTAPRRNIILLAALVIGLLFPTIILIVMQGLDTLVRSRADLSSLKVPFLGEIPILNRKKRKLHKNGIEQRVQIVVADKSRNMINEAFRNIRNNIDFMRTKNNSGSVIMATSLFTGSGKTFISSNVALSMAIKGANTIILDLDLRKATLSKLVDSPKQGLSDYLASKIDSIEQVVIKSEQNPNLDIVPVGKIPPNPSELILSERFTELIVKLRTKYEYIFLDCPPVEIVSETAIIGKNCDLTLFIIRVGVFDKRILPEIEDIYKSGKYNNMGVILNDVEYGSNRYGYGKYGYGKYGYGNDNEEPQTVTNNL